jgi:hypothetical protein
MNEQKMIYVYNDDISFRQCSLAEDNTNLKYGDCTNFTEKQENWKSHYYCNQYGIHLQCTKHPTIELNVENRSYGNTYLKCPKCNKNIEIENFDGLLKNCLKKLNYFKLKDYNLIRIDDWYYPEIKEKVKTESDYWITVDIKKDKDQDTIIVIYVGKKGVNEKVQFFVKPEKLQLSNDYKDLDPATILSKIEVTLKDRTIIQKYDNNNAST